MRYVFAAIALFATPAFADSVWVQAVPGGYEARIITEATSCPVLKDRSGDLPMTQRAPASGKFPMVCAAPVHAGMHATINGVPVPSPVSAPRRILVLGDTGCRIKGSVLQACNDPAQWPFPRLAAAAAKLKPDLIVHVGDYLYRESACPQDAMGCAGSPYGDNWITWQADFFSPAAPLMAAAPLVIVRGNHEECGRAGPGWTRLLSPQAFDPAKPCTVHLPPYTVDLASVRLAVMDDASAQDTSVTKADLPVYASEIAGLADIAGPVWFVHHRPIWAAISGPLDIPVGGNLTLMEAAGQNPIPQNVALQLSGHIHSFEAINYDKPVPPQIVAGNGGDKLDGTPRSLRGAIFQGHSGIRVADGMSVDSFGFLLMTRASRGWTVDLYNAEGDKTGQCRFRDQTAPRSRVDCAP